MENDSKYGTSHLADLPVTTTYGIVLLGVLVLLIMLRVLFADVSVRGGAR